MVHNGGGESDRERGYAIAAITRALDVLTAFEAPPHEFGPSELARQLGMTKNHVFRVLKTLEQRDFVRRVDDRYTIGMRAFDIGQLALQRLDVVRMARPILNALHQRTGETIHLAVLDTLSLDAVCLERIESRQPVRLSAEIGRRSPLHAGACPKVLLAYLPEAEREHVLERELPAFTPRTARTPDALRAELDAIRHDGFAVSDEDLDIGAAAVAAPVRNWTGEVVAAVSVAGPVARIGGCLTTTLRAEVVAAADAISTELGYSRARKGISPSDHAR